MTRERVSAFLLLQRLELLPEAALAEAEAGTGSVLTLQDLDTCIDAGSGDASRVERMTEIHDSAGGFHHRILLVILDQLAEGGELLAATDVVFVVLGRDEKVKSDETSFSTPSYRRRSRVWKYYVANDYWS